jgi:putative endonuclease
VPEPHHGAGTPADAHDAGPPREVHDAGACWHLYLLRRADGALYTGITTDVQRRLAEHALGGARAARSLRARGPLTVVYRAAIGSHGMALRAEHRVKALDRHAKEALVRLQPDASALLAGLGL